MDKRYELVVFDWDGTLMDSEARIVACMQRAAADSGEVVPSVAAARDIIGLGLDEAVRRLFPDCDAHGVAGLVDAYRTHWLGDDVDPAVMFRGADEVVARLHEDGWLLAVATGKSRRGLDKSLDDSGLARFFHATRCADETFSKPHPMMLEEILADLDTPPQRALVVGDTEYDMQMAGNAGVDAVGVAHGVHSAERLLAHGARHCFTDLPALGDWLLGGAAASMEG
ncbi:MAG: HAD-IA family hydrolase [Gammaproteobacteria bacterium]|nr:HAD-IA family hydrolase [Gammaproteobacteria bacterium]